MSYRTGLRNRYRNGRGSYSRKGKGRRAEVYDRPYLDHPDHPNGVQYSCCTKKGKSDGDT